MFWFPSRSFSLVCFGPFILTELVDLSQVWRPSCSHTPFSAHTCYIGLRSGLCDGHAKTLTLLSLNHFVTNLVVCLWSLSIWKTHLNPSFNWLLLLQYFLMMSTIYWSPPVPPAAEHPHNMMLPPPYFTVMMVFSVSNLPPFSSKCNIGHYGQAVQF